MGDWLPPTDYSGKDKKILRKTIGSLISIIVYFNIILFVPVFINYIIFEILYNIHLVK